MKRLVIIFLIIFTLIFFSLEKTILVENLAEYPLFRQNYLAVQVKQLDKMGYETPYQIVAFRYLENGDENWLMSISYLPLENPEKKGLVDIPITLNAYPLAFEEFNEDDFLLSLIHEFNHARALNRQKIITEEKDYLFSKRWEKRHYELKWKDLFNEELYGVKIDNFEEAIRRGIKRDILELLAIGEELHFIRNNKFNISERMRETRWLMYRRYYFNLFDKLEDMDADPEMINILIDIFNQPWLDTSF